MGGWLNISWLNTALAVLLNEAALRQEQDKAILFPSS